MKKYQNESTIDRLVRLLIGGLFIVIAYFWLNGILQTILYILGIVSLVTSITGFCGLYKILGISTLSKENK